MVKKAIVPSLKKLGKTAAMSLVVNNGTTKKEKAAIYSRTSSSANIQSDTHRRQLRASLNALEKSGCKKLSLKKVTECISGMLPLRQRKTLMDLMSGSYSHIFVESIRALARKSSAIEELHQAAKKNTVQGSLLQMQALSCSTTTQAQLKIFNAVSWLPWQSLSGMWLLTGWHLDYKGRERCSKKQLEKPKWKSMAGRAILSMHWPSLAMKRWRRINWRNNLLLCAHLTRQAGCLCATLRSKLPNALNSRSQWAKMPLWHSPRMLEFTRCSQDTFWGCCCGTLVM